MIELDHLNLMVADVPRSRAFYEELLAPFGFPVNRDFGDVAVGFGAGPNAILALVRADSRVQPIHISLRLDTRAEVDRFYSRALQRQGFPSKRAARLPQFSDRHPIAWRRKATRALLCSYARREA